MVYKIAAKSAPYILFPSNAVEPAFWHRLPGELYEFVGTDDIVFVPEFLHTWSGECDDLAECCERRFGMPFESMRSLWIGRLGTLDSYWHFIRRKNG